MPPVVEMTASPPLLKIHRRRWSLAYSPCLLWQTFFQQFSIRENQQHEKFPFLPRKMGQHEKIPLLLRKMLLRFSKFYPTQTLSKIFSKEMSMFTRFWCLVFMLSFVAHVILVKKIQRMDSVFLQNVRCKKYGLQKSWIQHCKLLSEE